jgi:hypothetical protein
MTRLGHPRLPLHLAVLALVLTCPALWLGWQLDDYLHRLHMLSPSSLIPGQEKIFSAFNFMNGDPDLNRLGKDLGLLPWWTADDFRFRFFRYLSSLTIWVDYRLWPDWPSLMHLQSLFWYAALVAAAAVLYRRIMGLGWPAGLAALLYTVDEAHALPAAWLANRNALLSVFFGVLCLIAHDDWRRSGKRRSALAAPLCLALALLSGETALAAAGYLLAYALFLDRRGFGQRFLSLLPCGAVLLTWAAVYKLLGFGTQGSGSYLDPLGSPLEFTKALLLRAPLLWLGQWSPLPADSVNFISEKAGLLLGLAFLIIILSALIPLLRTERAARFWFLGMILSIVPVAATNPSNRLLLFVGLGAMGLLAQFLGKLLDRSTEFFGQGRRGRSALILGGFLAVVHLIIAPLAMAPSMYSIKFLSAFYLAPIKYVPDDPRIAGQDLILANPPDYIFSVNLIKAWKFKEGKPSPRRIRALAVGPTAVIIHRLDRYSLLVKIPGGLFKGFEGHLLRSPDNPLPAGQEVRIADLSVKVVRVDKNNGPEEIIYRFSLPLEDASLRWLQWKEETYIPFVPPSPGQTVTLAAGNPFDLAQRFK